MAIIDHTAQIRTAIGPDEMQRQSWLVGYNYYIHVNLPELTGRTVASKNLDI